MTTLYVQFSDANKTAITTLFGCAQDDAESLANYAEIDSTDARYIAFIDPASTLTGAQAAQAAIIDSAYLAAIQVDVSFTTTAGVAKTYQADCISNSGTDSQNVLLKTVTGFNMVGTVPAGFAWKTLDNTMVVFTLDDLKGLYAAMLTQGQVAFARKSTLKAEIAAATSISDAQAITWDAP